jgi:hypothetical protein
MNTDRASDGLDKIIAAYKANCGYVDHLVYFESDCQATEKALRSNGIYIDDGIRMIKAYADATRIKDLPRHITAAVNETSRLMNITSCSIDVVEKCIDVYGRYTSYDKRVTELSGAVYSTIQTMKYLEIPFNDEKISHLEVMAKAYMANATINPHITKLSNVINNSLNYMVNNDVAFSDFMVRFDSYKKHKRNEDLKAYAVSRKYIEDNSGKLMAKLKLSGTFLKFVFRNRDCSVQDIFETVSHVE